MSQLRVNLVQACLQWRDPQQNRDHLERLIQSAEPADLHVLPETFTTGFLGETRATDEGMEGETLRWMKSLARDCNAALCGSAVIADEAGRRNRFLFVTSDGELHFYDKRHLFSFAGEDQRYVAGKDRVLLDYRNWRVNPQICYDLRFPVWCRSRGDFDLQIYVANWPSPRVAAWDTLLRARAVENQCYVVAVNRVGEDGKGASYPGHSAIYDPLGEDVISPWSEEGVKSATIELNRVTEVREQFPFAREADEFSLR